MAFNLVLNSNNVVIGTNNNTYKYNFIGNSLTILDDAEICVSSIQIPYSWYNVSKAYGNTKIQLIFPNLTTGITPYSITLNEGFYLVTDLNAAIQQFCINNGLYLINSLGQFVYYLSILYNISTYGVQLISYAIPTSLPTGWTLPSNWNGFYATSACPQLIIPASSTFGNIIGFTTGTFPSSNTLAFYSILNTAIPVGSNVNSLIIRCSLVDNPVGVPTDILDTMPVTSTFGSNINYQPPIEKWIKMSAGVHQFMSITFVDQNLNSLIALDSNVCISLLIKNKGKEVVQRIIEKLNIRI